MYDEAIGTISFTADELDLIKEGLEIMQDHAVGIAESLTIETLLEKLDEATAQKCR